MQCFWKRAASLMAMAGLAFAQTNTPGGWEGSQNQEVLLAMKAGQFARVKELVSELLTQATHTGAQPDYLAALWQLRGAAENQLSRYAEAEAALNQGVNILDRAQGKAPKVLISLLVSRAEARLSQNRPQQAEADLRRALAAGHNLPQGDPHIALIWDGFGLVYWARGKQAQAENAVRHALAILEKHYGADHPDVNAEASNLATILVHMGRTKEALPLIVRSRKSVEERFGPMHPEAIRAAYAEAAALLVQAPAKTERILRDALENWERAGQPKFHANVALFYNTLAEARYRQGDVAGAVHFNGLALDTLRAVLGPEHPQVVARMADHARLLKKAKRGKEAAALQKEADRIRALPGYAEHDRHSIDIRAFERRR